MSLKIGNLDIQAIKVGSADCKVYIGNELLYPSGFTGKFKATYASGPDYTLDCDGNTTLTTGNTKPSGYEYTAMTKAVIGDCVTSIGIYAFSGCTSLTSIDIPSGVTSIINNAFSLCSSLTSIDIPSGVINIGNSAFSNCRSLTSINIPSGITSINNFVFRGCRSLASIDIPSNVTTIDNSAFADCSGLTSVTIPSGVTSIGTNTFRSCTSLTSVTVNATTPPSLGGSTFDNTNNCPIYVPAASVETYKAASGWSTYASRIQAIPTPSLTWVQFNSGDTINGLNYYGIRGAANEISNTFTVVAGEDIVCDYIRNVVEVTISNCHSETITPPETNVEYVFSNLGCSDYYTINNLQTAYSTFELLILQ